MSSTSTVSMMAEAFITEEVRKLASKLAVVATPADRLTAALLQSTL